MWKLRISFTRSMLLGFLRKEQWSSIDFQIQCGKAQPSNCSHIKAPLGLEFISSGTGLRDTFIYRHMTVWDSKK